MADLAFNHELAAHKDPYGLERTERLEPEPVTYTKEEREQVDDMFPDIFDRPLQKSSTPGYHQTWNDPPPFAPRDVNEPWTDPNWVGPWADNYVSNDDFGRGAAFKAKHRTNHMVASRASESKPEREKSSTWSQLSQATQHFLLKVASDYHLQKFTGIDFSSKEKRKAVFKDATVSLSLSEEQTHTLLNKYHVKGRRTPEVSALYNPKKHISTTSTTITSGVTPVIEEARRYVADNYCNHLNQAIDQLAPKIDETLLETTYFGLPEVTERWKPDAGTLAEKLTVAAFSIATGAKGKCHERLRIHQLLLPSGSFIYSLSGVRQLPAEEGGLYTFTYPEAYDKVFAKHKTTEVLMCTAKSNSNMDDIVCQEYDGPDFVDPSELQCNPYKHVGSSFHTLWGAGRSAPIGPDLFKHEKNEQLQKANKDFDAFNGFFQFHLPAGFQCYGPSGKKVSLDISLGHPKPADEVSPGTEGWYTIMTSTFKSNAFNGREQQVFNNDFILRMKFTQPVAVLRDLQLMPRVTEPGVHHFSITNDHGVDLRSENGDYYLWNDMAAPEDAWVVKYRDTNPYDIPDASMDITVPSEYEPFYDPAESDFDALFADVRDVPEENLVDIAHTAGPEPISRKAAQPEKPAPSLSAVATIVANEVQAETLINTEQDEEARKRVSVIDEGTKTLEPHKPWLESQEKTAVKQDNKEHLKQVEEARRAKVLEEQNQKAAPQRSRPVRHDPEDDDYTERTGPATKVIKRSYQKKEKGTALPNNAVPKSAFSRADVGGSVATNTGAPTSTVTKNATQKKKNSVVAATEGSQSQARARRSVSVEPTAALSRPRRSVSVEPQPIRNTKATTKNRVEKKTKSVVASVRNYGTAAQDRPRRSRSTSVEPTAASSRSRRSVSVEQPQIWKGTANLKRPKRVSEQSEAARPAKIRKIADQKAPVPPDGTIKNVNKSSFSATTVATNPVKSRKREISEEAEDRPTKVRKTKDDRAESSTVESSAQKKRKEITQRVRQNKLKQTALSHGERQLPTNESDAMEIDNSHTAGQSKITSLKKLVDGPLPTINEDEGDTTDLDEDETAKQKESFQPQPSSSNNTEKEHDPYTYHIDPTTGQPQFSLNVEMLDPKVRNAIKKKLDSGERLRSESFSEFNLPPPCPERLKALGRTQPPQAPLSPPQAAGDLSLTRHRQPYMANINTNTQAFSSNGTANDGTQDNLNIAVAAQILAANNMLGGIPPAFALANPSSVLAAWQNMQLMMTAQLQGVPLPGLQIPRSAASSQLPTPTSPMFPFPFPLPQMQSQAQTSTGQSDRVTELSSSPLASPQQAERNAAVEIQD